MKGDKVHISYNLSKKFKKVVDVRNGKSQVKKKKIGVNNCRWFSLKI